MLRVRNEKLQGERISLLYAGGLANYCCPDNFMIIRDSK